MSNFKYLKISKSKKLRYLSINQNSNLSIVFLHGFMSDIEGDKPKNFLNYCKKRKLGFLAVEYSGHGKSSGKFNDSNISKWTEDVKVSINKIINKKKFILIGSSMGSWLSLNQFKYFKNQIKGFLGIGSGPEFLERLMWKNFSDKVKREIIQKGIYQLKHGEYEYPITYQLIKDGRKNKILNKKIYNSLNVTMVHGKKDNSVPLIYSKKVLKIFKNAKKRLVVVKNGDHSLSSPKWLNLLKKELMLIIN